MRDLSEPLPQHFHSAPRSDTGADERDTFQASDRGVPMTPPETWDEWLDCKGTSEP